jgi:hypothetical protein
MDFIEKNFNIFYISFMTFLLVLTASWIGFNNRNYTNWTFQDSQVNQEGVYCMKKVQKCGCGKYQVYKEFGVYK